MTDVLISAGELAELASKEACVIIDTRNPPAAYAAGHLPNAVNVHEIFTYLATSTPEGMQELKTKFADAFGKAGPVRQGNCGHLRAVDELRLRPVLPRLLSPDHARLIPRSRYCMAASMPGPVRVCRSRPRVPAPAPASFAIIPEAGDILIDAGTMLAAVGKPGIALLDVRDVDEWIGESSSPYGKDFCPRKGRIPRRRLGSNGTV